MTILQFEEVIKAYITRQGSSLMTGDNQSLLRVAVNNAKIYAQRTVDFNFLKDSVYIDCNPRGSILTGMKLESDNSAVKIKNLKKAYKLIPNGQAKIPIKYVSQAYLAEAIQKRGDLCQVSNEDSRQGLNVFDYAVQHGTSIYQYPTPNVSYRLYFDAVIWIAPYAADGDTDFFLEYCVDFLMYRTLVELNYFIKEDERFDISQQLLTDAWNSMLNWNDSLVSPTDTETDL